MIPKKQRNMRVANIRSTTRSGFAQGQIVVGVDSSKKAPGWACASAHGRIVAAGIDDNPGAGEVAFELPTERPHVAVYEVARFRSTDPRPQDLIDESCGGALTAGSFRADRVVPLMPDEWTSGASKPARHDRIWEALDRDERAIVAAASGKSELQIRNYIDAALELAAYGRNWKNIYTHRIKDILDAVGIVLFAVGRMGRGAKPQRPRPPRRATK